VKNNREILLASRWPASKVRSCLRRKDRPQLVRFLKDRHEERFFGPIDHIAHVRGNELGVGFSVMALCSLLIETMQCYRDGLPTTDRRELDRLRSLKRTPPAYQIPASLRPNGKEEFRRFFAKYRNEFSGLRPSAFYRKIRNGILHQGQTKGGWTLRRSDSVVCDPGKKIIYRNRFATQLRSCFDGYLEELRVANWSEPIWNNAARKIWWLIRLSR